jgi:hypothetical protein
MPDKILSQRIAPREEKYNAAPFEPYEPPSPLVNISDW